jgi:tetratricopeptide (TPR) repeat protein
MAHVEPGWPLAVFSSKAHSDYTQLYLTRINEKGEASPPVWLAHLVEPGRAANIPEFVDAREDSIVRIREQFLDDTSFTRAGNQFYRAGDPDSAIEKYQQALSLNPQNAMAHQKLGFLLFNVKHRPADALPHLENAVRLEPRNPFARFDLGMALLSRGNASNAEPHLAEAARLLPNGYDRQYNLIDLNYNLAMAHYLQGHYNECAKALEAVLCRRTNHARANYLMAMCKAWLGGCEETREYYQAAVRADQSLGHLPDYSEVLSRNYARKGRFAEAFEESEKGWRLAVTAGRTEQAARLKETMEQARLRK